MAAQFGYEERMFRILVRLKDEFGVTNLQTFMCNTPRFEVNTRMRIVEGWWSNGIKAVEA